MTDTETLPVPDKTLSRLQKALANRELVRIRRDIRRAERLTGYVVAVGERWLLMAGIEDGITLDGYQALRLADVSSIKRRKESEEFTRRALDLGGQWPPHAPAAISLDDDAQLLADAGRAYPLLALYVEHEDPDVCHVGKPLDGGRRGFDLLAVTADAEWEESPTRFKFADVTRVDFGGRYEDVLTRLAGPPPAPAQETAPAEEAEPPAVDDGASGE